MLEENFAKNKTNTDNYKLAEMYNKFFSNIVKNLDISSNVEGVTSTMESSDPVLSTTKKYGNHSSILRIKGEINNNTLLFSFVNTSKVIK